jgi:hypothetical protein
VCSNGEQKGERERGLGSGLNRQAGEAVEAEAGVRLMAIIKVGFEGTHDGPLHSGFDGR